MIGARFVFPDKSRVPTSKAMEKARLETFAVGDGWIHDKIRGHGASSKKVRSKASSTKATTDNPLAGESGFHMHSESSG